MTPGGGLKPGETPAAGVIRELREETGFQLTDVGSPVAFAAGRWRSRHGVLFDQVTWYFFVRGIGGKLDLSGQEQHERVVLRQHRWMTVSEIAATQHVSPLGLVDLLPLLLAAHRPETPLRFPWRDD
ncbi:NUDIX domain-containing protein [Catelliglobosispora koreensis]|uniref:NUDIX domain-containing protein n=1 Tax=Catelliglobosispora koreensis TaxID=129052 RepID=UPI000A00D17F|nr:NUDIX domain-containing protein [Catelliglobosispora koreensis]